MIASGTYPNVEDFRKEFKVLEATVHRDLDALRWQFGAEFLLEYDRTHKGYYYTRPLPVQQLVDYIDNYKAG